MISEKLFDKQTVWRALLEPGNTEQHFSGAWHLRKKPRARTKTDERVAELRVSEEMRK